MKTNIKTKIKSYKNKIKADFHDEIKLPEQTLCLTYSIILTDSVCTSDKTYYSRVLLEESKYIIEDKEIKRFINEGLTIYEEESKNKNDDEY